jgi:hypothetical protein
MKRTHRPQFNHQAAGHAVVQAGGSLAHADEAVSAPAAAMRAKYAALQGQLDHSQLQQANGR